MLKKLHILLNFSNLVVSNQVSRIFVDMRNFVAKFGEILEHCGSSDCAAHIGVAQRADIICAPHIVKGVNQRTINA